MAHFLFNFSHRDPAGRSPREQAGDLVRLRMCAVGGEEPHRDELAAGDLALIYLGAPERTLVGRAELASAVHRWTTSEAEAYPGDSASGVSLAHVEEWDPPVPMEAVLSRIDGSEGARADFDIGVVWITPGEYETALSVRTERLRSAD